MICLATIKAALLALGLVVTFGIGLLVMVLAGLRDKRVFYPAGRRKLNVLLFLLWLAVVAVFGLNWLNHRNRSPWPLLPLGLLVLISGYEAFRPRTAREEIQEWACDTRHCGRCGYDLTGNVSGICPECGTPIPRSAAEVEKPWWVAWWLQWRIDHLDDWRKALAAMVVYAVLLAALAIWMAFGKYSPMVFALLPGLVCVNMVINCVRVLQYRRRIGGR